MKDFVQAFGGLIGVALIGIAVVAVMIVADWLMTRSQGRRAGKTHDGAPPPP